MTEELQRGVIPLARYHEQQLPEYQDNPLIVHYLRFLICRKWSA